MNVVMIERFFWESSRTTRSRRPGGVGASLAIGWDYGGTYDDYAHDDYS
jgi:hypothetical protein